MNDRTTKIKEHFKKHGKIYAVGGGALAIGIGVGFIASPSAANQRASIKQIFAYKSPPTINLEQTVLIRRGHPGNVVRCIETGELFASQNRAAQLLGINPGDLSSHLNGKYAKAGGLTFERIREAV